MTITAVYDYFAPEIADVMSEAFELAGIAPSAVGQDHIDSCIRSMQFMLQGEWTTLQIKQWTIVHYQQSLSAVTPSVPYFTLPTGAIDIFNATLIRDSRASPMYRTSRREYQEIPDKTPTGRPSRYWVERASTGGTVYIWQPPSVSSDVMDIYYVRQISSPGAMANTLEMPPHFTDAFVHGVAARLALKFNPSKYAILWSLYNGPNPDVSVQGGKLRMALDEDRERADVKLTISLRRP